MKGNFTATYKFNYHGKKYEKSTRHNRRSDAGI